MTRPRPALTSLLALTLALPALPAAAGEGATSPLAALARSRRCVPAVYDPAMSGRASVVLFPAGAETWDTDLESVAPDGQLCDDAVWRLVDQPGARAKWGAATTAPAQAQVLSAAAGVLDKVDADVARLEDAADKVYGAAQAANIIKGVQLTQTKLKRAVFTAATVAPNDAPTQFDGSDADSAGKLLAARAEALATLAVEAPPAKDAKPGTPRGPAQPGPLVLSYYKALDAVRADVAAAAALGVSVRPVPALLSAGGTKLAPGYSDAAKRLASAQTWDDTRVNGSAMDVLQDRALRNRVALNSANVEAVFQEAANIAGSARAGLSVLDGRKKKALDDLNAKLRAKVADATGYADAKRAFDGDAAHDSGYAQTAEGQYRADELQRANRRAQSATIASNGRGGYQLMMDGKTVDGRADIPDLKTAQQLLNSGQLTDQLAESILKDPDHTLLAKTKAALAAARDGTLPSLTTIADPNGITKNWAGFDKPGESLADYQKRLRDQELEAHAKSSARRQVPLEAYRDALQKADAEYASNLAGKMNPDVAERLRQKAKKEAHEQYIAATQASGSLDSDIADHQAYLSRIDQVAATNFVDKIKDAAGDLKSQMRGDLKKYVGEPQARVLLTDGGADDGSGTLFDQFIAEEWTWGSPDIDKNANDCKSSYRQGDYASLEKCAGKSLNAWLARRKAGTAVAAPGVDDQVRAGDRQGR